MTALADPRSKTKRNPLTAYICQECRDCNKQRTTHPGMLHKPGICDCGCRD